MNWYLIAMVICGVIIVGCLVYNLYAYWNIEKNNRRMRMMRESVAERNLREGRTGGNAYYDWRNEPPLPPYLNKGVFTEGDGRKTVEGFLEWASNISDEIDDLKAELSNADTTLDHPTFGNKPIVDKDVFPLLEQRRKFLYKLGIIQRIINKATQPEHVGITTFEDLDEREVIYTKNKRRYPDVIERYKRDEMIMELREQGVLNIWGQVRRVMLDSLTPKQKEIIDALKLEIDDKRVLKFLGR